MANEYLQYNAAAEVLYSVVSSAPPGVLQYQAAVELLLTPPSLDVISVYGVGVEVLFRYVDQRLSLKLLDASGLGSVYAPKLSQTGVAVSGPEINPYRPTIPEELWDFSPMLARYLREQAEILRRQHNLIQAGDTTFPWELLTSFSDSQIYNLGAIGRFYHPDYGVIVARYVQFTDWAVGAAAVGPVGRVRQGDSQEWVVTNDLEISTNELVVGVAFLQATPSQGSYGWAVFNGVNPLTMQGLGVPASPSQPYTWQAAGLVKAGGIGTVVGTRKSTRNDSFIRPGEFYVAAGGLSSESIIQLVQAQLDSIADSSILLADRVSDLESDMASEQSLSLAFANSILELTNRLTKEEQTRSAAIDSLYELLEGGAITQAELDASILALTIQFDSQIAMLSGTVQVAQSRADAAYSLASAIDSAGILNSISGLTLGLAAATNRILTLENQPAGGKIIPVVTGDIPPVLVYDEDGSLVYAEI